MRKLKIQKMTQKLDSLLENIHALEQSKMMCNRYEASQLRKEYKTLSEERLNLKKDEKH